MIQLPMAAAQPQIASRNADFIVYDLAKAVCLILGDQERSPCTFQNKHL